MAAGTSPRYRAATSGLAAAKSKDVLGSERVTSVSETQEAHPLQALHSGKEELESRWSTQWHTSRSQKMSFLNLFLGFSLVAGRSTSRQADVHAQSLSCVWLFATPRTIACPAPLSMGFCRQEHCSGLPFPPPGELPNPGMEPLSPALEGGIFTTEPPGKPREAESCPQMKHPICEVCRPQLSSLECVERVAGYQPLLSRNVCGILFPSAK